MVLRYTGCHVREPARKVDTGRPYWNKKIRQLSGKILTLTRLLIKVQYALTYLLNIYTTCLKEKIHHKKHTMLQPEYN